MKIVIALLTYNFYSKTYEIVLNLLFESEEIKYMDKSKILKSGEEYTFKEVSPLTIAVSFSLKDENILYDLVDSFEKMEKIYRDALI